MVTLFFTSPPPPGFAPVPCPTTVALAVGLSLSSTWIALRHDSAAWVLQDILGFFLLCSFLESIYITTLKVCATGTAYRTPLGAPPLFMSMYPNFTMPKVNVPKGTRA